MKRTRSKHNKKRKFSKKRSFKKGERFYTKKDIFVSRMASIMKVSPKLAKDFFSQRAVSTIRLNPLAGDTREIYKKLVKKGCEMVEIPWLADTYIVTNKDKSELGEMEEYEKGLFYIQNLSSMMPAYVLDLHEGEQILDMCAAPGSKTTQMAAITGNKAYITAVEDDFKRGVRMKHVLSMFRVRNTDVVVMDAVDYSAKLLADHDGKQFDKILVDAPCSGSGTVFLQGHNPLRFWSIKKAKGLSKLQKKLITSGFQLLKPGGTMVYSTCSLDPLENEAVVTELLERFPSAQMQEIKFDKDVMKFHIDGKEIDFTRYLAPGITKWSGQKFHPDNKKALRILPSAYTEGFFIAKVGKAS